MQIELTALRGELIKSKEFVMGRRAQANSDYVREILGVEVRVIERILIFLHECEKEREMPKEKLPLVLSEEAISLEELGERRQQNELEAQIITVAARLKELMDKDLKRPVAERKYKKGAALPIDIKQVDRGYFRTKVHEMVREKKLPEWIRPRERKEAIWLAHLDPTNASPKDE